MESDQLQTKLNMGISPEEYARQEEYQAKCTSCGACCCFFAREPAMIGADGPASEDPNLSYYREKVVTFTWPDGDKEEHRTEEYVMLTKQLEGFPACIALEGKPGEKVGCGIYETRPKHCRMFVPGSNMCITARKWAGFE